MADENIDDILNQSAADVERRLSTKNFMDAEAQNFVDSIEHQPRTTDAYTENIDDILNQSVAEVEDQISKKMLIREAAQSSDQNTDQMLLEAEREAFQEELTNIGNSVVAEMEEARFDDILDKISAEALGPTSREQVDMLLYEADNELPHETTESKFDKTNSYKKSYVPLQESQISKHSQYSQKQQLDYAYFRSMVVDKKFEMIPSSPLRKAISEGDHVGVHMVMRMVLMNHKK